MSRKWIKLVAVLIVVMLIGAGMYFVVAANAFGEAVINNAGKDELHKVTSELKKVMESTVEETIRVYAWLEDIDLETVKASIPATLSESAKRGGIDSSRVFESATLIFYRGI